MSATATMRQRPGNARYPSMWKPEIAPAPMTATLIIALLFCCPACRAGPRCGAFSLLGGVAEFVGALGQGGDDVAAVLVGEAGQRDGTAQRVDRRVSARDGDSEAAQPGGVLARFIGPAAQPGLGELGMQRPPVGDSVRGESGQCPG